MDDMEDAIASAVWAWRTAEQSLEDYEVPDVDDLRARNGQHLDALKQDVAHHRQAVVDLARQRPGPRTFDVVVDREDRWLIVRVPEIDCVTQAKRPATVEFMARDLIATWLDVASEDFDVRVHSRVRGLPERPKVPTKD